MAHDILIVDDEADIRMLTAGILEDEGYETREAGGDIQALESVKTRRPSLVLLDIWLQGSRLDGLGILKALKKDHPDLPVVMMSGHGTIETAVKALHDGAYDFIEKPFKTDRLLMSVERALETADLRRENAELRSRGAVESQLVGTSSRLNQLRQAVEKVATSNSRVLINGPAGSGKEVAARHMHLQSKRAKGPFVVLNCATMEADVVESELFGIEADGKPGKVGFFEQAHNGTLLLDEVSDMPQDTQGKIVRVLQEQRFQRVGGNVPVEVDVRVVAASSKDLSLEMAEGRFREDLFYRLSVVPIDIPALNEHREDIAQLAQYFMTKTAEALGHAPRTFNDDALAAMQAYDWPGNVRELRNVVERVLIMAPGDASQPISAEMLPREVTTQDSESLKWDQASEIMGLPLRDAREIFEREYLSTQINRFGGNISKTASFVGMERSALHRKLKSLSLTTEEKAKA
ncbi:Nitrogen assimilation regulatory protein NtrX [Candidatus Terasakiella magnetica]|uniref:Nitrogen assimilation regulatory protein NtrX n=1 Tax=Candidatus Terasakiella magnetica TaxID=1867952 RepID=A0A1C3RD10_9PROT|nr:sigma-54 dependent transcriptional regulator [Candidatus Terasakiella magnetica]SCA55169.1 Nitrogen assimilation regulatory protein NtrX [Candidatus Terasakiella magnetica]